MKLIEDWTVLRRRQYENFLPSDRMYSLAEFNICCFMGKTAYINFLIELETQLRNDN
jgi:hypothetical protein